MSDNTPTQSGPSFWELVSQKTGFPIADGKRRITLTTTNGNPKSIEIPEGKDTISIQDAINLAGLTVSSATIYMVDGATVPANTEVSEGAIVTIIAPAKGA